MYIHVVKEALSTHVEIFGIIQPLCNHFTKAWELRGHGICSKYWRNAPGKKKLCCGQLLLIEIHAATCFYNFFS